MLLAKLDNEAIFKKAFADPHVFQAFVKDITGVEMDMTTTKIETVQAEIDKGKKIKN